MKTKTITIIGVFTALLCIVGPLTVPLPFTPVPFSLVTLIINTTQITLPTVAHIPHHLPSVLNS